MRLPIVFEFKTTGGSREDRFIYLQILERRIPTMERELSESETGVVPQAITIIVYTGQTTGSP